MARATERPFGVSFAAGWAAVASVLPFLRAVGGLFAALAVSPGSALLGLVLAAVWLPFGAVLLVTAGGRYRVQGWARLAGVVLFGVFTLLQVAALVGDSVFAVVPLGLHGTALALLVLNGDAFRSERPDVDDSGSASRFGAP